MSVRATKKNCIYDHVSQSHFPEKNNFRGMQRNWKRSSWSVLLWTCIFTKTETQNSIYFRKYAERLEQVLLTFFFKYFKIIRFSKYFSDQKNLKSHEMLLLCMDQWNWLSEVKYSCKGATIVCTIYLEFTGYH